MKFIWSAIGLLVGIGFVAMAISALNNSAANKIHARAFFIAQQGQVRMDTAQAMLPYFVLGIIALALIGILALGKDRNDKLGRQQIIERHYYYSERVLIAPPRNRRQFYESLSESRITDMPTLQLGAKKKDV